MNVNGMTHEKRRTHWMVVPALAAVLVQAPLASAQHNQENPPESSVATLSGITLLSGWKCNPGAISFSIDGGSTVKMASGTTRGDTAGVCQNTGLNGYGALFNVSLFGDGSHVIRVFDNGVKFAETTFQVATLGGELFVQGKAAAVDVFDFPDPGHGVLLEWATRTQGFEITAFCTGDECGRPGVLSTSSVWASDTQLVYCTATNQSGEPRPVKIDWVGEDGSVIKSLEFIEDPGRPAYSSIQGRNQFVSCRFDTQGEPKAGYRANLFVTDPQVTGHVFYTDARGDEGVSPGRLATNSVYASSTQLVYCTATNQAAEPRPVTIDWIGESGNVIKSLEFVEDPGRPAYSSIQGQDQFVSCRFDTKNKPKDGYRANLFVTDPQVKGNVFYTDAK